MNKVHHIGFTGTREGMSEYQKYKLSGILQQAMLLAASEGSELVFHHGDCVGADAEAHAIAQSHKVNRIVIHPPKAKSHRAFCGKGESNVTWEEPEEYLERDRQIVDACEGMLAAPKSDIEERRSGTWYTVRYARKMNKKAYLLPRTPV